MSDVAEGTQHAVSRRGFLQGLGTAAGTLGAVGAAPLLAASESRMAAPAAITGGDGPEERLRACYEKRVDAADRMFAAGAPDHPTNGDEQRYASRAGNFTKGLPHAADGEVEPDAYGALLAALASGAPEDFEAIPIGGARRLVNPQAGLAFDTEGNDPHQLVQPPAPRLASAEAAGEMVELYWMALLRDVRFDAYEGSPLVRRAAAELSALSDFRGPRSASGLVNHRTLFRDVLPGVRSGPYVSQFLLLPTPFGAEYVERRMRTLLPGTDHGTTFGEWLAIQNGNVPGVEHFDPVRRHVRNGRDLAQWVHIDVLFQAYFNACLILGTPPSADPNSGGIGCPLNTGNPYHGSLTQDGFGTWGPPGFKTLLCEVSTRALKAVWFQKWFVHRRLRPEEYGGRVHQQRAGLHDYDLHPEVLESEALARVRARFGSDLLPLVFPEGSPIHPSYGAGHATVAGACVTILKALFDEDFEIPHPVVTSADGTARLPYEGVALTVGGELNKIASNVATGRNIAGVHWRSDAYESLRLGERVAIALLKDHLATFNEGGGCRFTGFDGQTITL